MAFKEGIIGGGGGGVVVVSSTNFGILTVTISTILVF